MRFPPTFKTAIPSANEFHPICPNEHTFDVFSDDALARHLEENPGLDARLRLCDPDATGFPELRHIFVHVRRCQEDVESLAFHRLNRRHGKKHTLLLIYGGDVNTAETSAVKRLKDLFKRY